MAYKGSRGWTRDRYCVTHSSAASARDSGNRRPLGAVPSHAITWPRVPPNHGLGEESCLFCLVGLSSLLLGGRVGLASHEVYWLLQDHSRLQPYSK